MGTDRMTVTADEGFMNEALALAREAGERGDVPVGAVVVKDGRIIGKGKNSRENGGSAVSHAEIIAIDEACRAVGGWRLTGCTLYVTLEPCPMCAGAVVNSRISRVVFGAYDRTAGAMGGRFSLLGCIGAGGVEVDGGVCGDECRSVLESFFSKRRIENTANKPVRLKREFFTRSAETVAPELLGKVICRKTAESDGTERAVITETECYLGTEDTACHASKGMTDRNRVMWSKGGTVYVYLCYGIHNMLNIVTGEKGNPQAVLIRGADGYDGPGRLTKHFGITRAMNGADVCLSDEIWIEDNGSPLPDYEALKRVGIDYASQTDRDRLWRYRIKK